MKARKKKWSPIRRNWVLCSIVFIAPALLMFLAFTYYPLIYSIYLSLTDWSGATKTWNFIGLDNYKLMLSDKILGQTIGNTIYFAVVLLLMGFALQLGSALIIFSKPRGHGVIKVLLYLPAVMSSIVLSFTWIQFLQYTGYINQGLEAVGLGEYAKTWLKSEKDVKFWLCLIQSLQYAGYGMVFFLTGLNSVPQDLLEAAEIDGAYGWRRFVRVILPLIMPSITVTLFISITGALNTYAIPFALTGGGPNGASTTLTMQIKQRAFSYRQFGYASAISVVFFLAIAGVTSLQLYLTKRREVEY